MHLLHVLHVLTTHGVPRSSFATSTLVYVEKDIEHAGISFKENII